MESRKMVPIFRAAMETQTERTDCGHSEEGEGGTNWENRMET